MKFDLNSFKNNEFAVRCKTEKQANAFLKLLHEKGIEWQCCGCEI